MDEQAPEVQSQTPEPSGSRLENLGPEEQATPVMIYTPNTFSWGKIITHEAIRPGIVLRAAEIPDYISLYEAHTLRLGGSGPPKPVAFAEYHIPSDTVIGFHLMPPITEPPDYDVDEPNRKMEPATVLVGFFRFDGNLRISTQTDLKRFLDVSKSVFMSIYDVKIWQPANPGMKPIHVENAQVRTKQVFFASRG